MNNFLIKIFVKNNNKTDDPTVRENYGVFGSTVGIISNFILFIAKLIIGIITKSVAITADSVNNLLDATSSVVSLVGFKLAAKPADVEHPFGHGRIEYLSGLFISIVILFLGFDFFKSSITKIFNPGEINFSVISILILLLTVAIKIWQSNFNKKIAELINSQALKATSQDSLNDVYVTMVTIVSILFTKFTGINVDGYAGVLVSIFLMYSGLSLAKDTISPILGESTSKELSEKIKKTVEKHEEVLGTHDLVVHDYGPSKRMATIHVEVPSNFDFNTIHEVIDKIERETLKELGIHLLIHMDPTCLDDLRIDKIKQTVAEVLKEQKVLLKTHDYRIIETDAATNVIFELTLPCDLEEHKLKRIIKSLNENILLIDSKYNIIININNYYISNS